METHIVFTWSVLISGRRKKTAKTSAKKAKEGSWSEMTGKIMIEEEESDVTMTMQDLKKKGILKVFIHSYS